MILKSLRKYILLVICQMGLIPIYCQQTKNPNIRHLLLRDEGLSQLSYVDLDDPSKDWFADVPPGRDLQLVGDGRVLIATGNGYEEREIRTGKKVFALTSFEGTITARRLRNGNTLLVGLDWQEKKGIGLLEVDKEGNIKHFINYPSLHYVRLIRETISGTYLITADTLVFEGDRSGKMLWNANISSEKRPHTWQAIRLANGTTMASCGFAGNLQIFDVNGNQLKLISGPDEVNPNFYAGFQILQNGNIVVTNWQGHGAGHGTSGVQLLAYNPGGKLVWSWKQDAQKYSSLQGVIVLDGLNLDYLHVEDADGKLAPVGLTK